MRPVVRRLRLGDLFGLRVSRKCTRRTTGRIWMSWRRGHAKSRSRFSRANVAGMQAHRSKKSKPSVATHASKLPFDGENPNSRMVDEGVVVNRSAAAAFRIGQSRDRGSLRPATWKLATTMSPGDARDNWRFARGETRQRLGRSCRTRRSTARLARAASIVRFQSRTRRFGIEKRAVFRQLSDACWVAGELPDLLFDERVGGICIGRMTGFGCRVKSLDGAPLAAFGRYWWSQVKTTIATCERRAVELLKTDGEHGLSSKA